MVLDSFLGASFYCVLCPYIYICISSSVCTWQRVCIFLQINVLVTDVDPLYTYLQQSLIICRNVNNAYDIQKAKSLAGKMSLNTGTMGYSLKVCQNL